MGQLETYQQKIKAKLADRRWRINNLYWITDKEGCAVKFKMNWAQAELYDEMHYLNCILKARQLGFSTFILVFMLDVCVFNSNTACGIIDATLDDAKSKLARIKWAYERLPEWLRNLNPIVESNATRIKFKNGSSISVGVSHRGGTLQYLHISEYGKICAKTPEKAREIFTGSLNTVQAGNFVFIESTAEGQSGRFFDLCDQSQSLQRLGRKLSPLDYKFFFYPWWREPGYRLEDDGETVIPEHMDEYFDKLAEKKGIKLSREQKIWYVKKQVTQLDDMKREYPATPEEAFEASVEGAIYGQQLRKIEEMQRVGVFEAVPGVPVHTFWDIGRRDYNSIWFAQILSLPEGPRVRLLKFYQNCFEALPFYARYVHDTFDEMGWAKGADYFPHDVSVVEYGSGRSRIEQALSEGLKAKRGLELSLHDGINAVRATLPYCEFDEAGCADGLAMLRQYRWEWNDKLGCWRTGTPAHDEASHGSDAFRTLGTTWRVITPEVVEETPTGNVVPHVITDEYTGRPMFNPDIAAIIEAKAAQRRRDAV